MRKARACWTVTYSDGFALVNYLLCTALKKRRNKGQDSRGAGQGNSSRIMQQNCGLHFRTTLEILEPTVIVAQGIDVRKWMSNALPIPPTPEAETRNEVVSIAGRSVNLFTFSHPSAGGVFKFWGNSPAIILSDGDCCSCHQGISFSKTVDMAPSDACRESNRLK